MFSSDSDKETNQFRQYHMSELHKLNVDITEYLVSRCDPPVDQEIVLEPSAAPPTESKTNAANPKTKHVSRFPPQTAARESYGISGTML